MRTVSTVSAYASGREWAAFVGPTSRPQRASRVCTLISVAQPLLSDQVVHRVGRAAWGRGRRAGRRTTADRSASARRRRPPALAGRRPTGRSDWARPSPVGSCCRARRLGRRSGRLRARLSSSAVTCTVRDQEPAALQLLGHVGADGRGDQHLLGGAAPRAASRSRRVLSSSANTSSSTSTGSTPSARSRWKLPSLQGQRQRPGLAVAGVPLGRQQAEAQHACRRGAARPGRRRAGSPRPGARSSPRPAARPAPPGSALSRSSVPGHRGLVLGRRVVVGRGDVGVGLAHVRAPGRSGCAAERPAARRRPRPGGRPRRPGCRPASAPADRRGTAR